MHTCVQLKLDRCGAVTVDCGCTDVGQGSDDVLVSLVALRRIESLQQVGTGSVEDPAVQLGAGLKLAAIVNSPMLQKQFTALWQAAGLVAGPRLRGDDIRKVRACSAQPSGGNNLGCRAL